MIPGGNRALRNKPVRKVSARDAGRYRGFDVRLLANWTDVKNKSTNGGVDVYA